MRGAALVVVIFILFAAQPALGARAKIETRAADPYLSALVVEADTGKILVDENSDAVAYPASVLKLMVLHVVLDRIAQGRLQLDDMVQVTREASAMGGSQVYLDPKEQFTVEDLLYALIIQSANDAAVALAVHVAGSKEAFVALMNDKAAALGMNSTTFHSVHGLPPSEGQQPDRSTARDLAILARELSKNPEVFKYTSTRERDFRGGEFIMRTHNKLLASVDGCDGFKTGYFKAAGFSIVATAKRSGVRIIAVVLGSVDRKVRDAKTSELLAIGFAKTPPRPEPPQPEKTPAAPAPQPQISAAPAVEPESPPAEQPPERTSSLGRDLLMISAGFLGGVLICVLVSMVRSKPRSRNRRLM